LNISGWLGVNHPHNTWHPTWLPSSITSIKSLEQCRQSSYHKRYTSYYYFSFSFCWY